MEVAAVDAVHVLQIALGGCRADICDAGVIEPIEIGDEDAEECEVLVLVVIDLVAEIDALGNQGSQVVIARGQIMGTADAAGVGQQCSKCDRLDFWAEDPAFGQVGVDRRVDRHVPGRKQFERSDGGESLGNARTIHAIIGRERDSRWINVRMRQAEGLHSNHKTMIQDEIGVANSLLLDSLVDAYRPIDIRQACTIVAYLSRSCMSGAGGIAGDQQWAQQHNTGEQDNQ